MEETTIDLRDLFKIIKRRRWIIIGITILSVLCGLVISFIPQNSSGYDNKKMIYKSTASIVIGTFPDLKSDNIKDITSLNQQIAKTYGNVATSRTVAEKTIEELGLNVETDKFMNKITVYTNAEAQVIRIYYADKEESNEQEILSSYVNNFIKEAQNIYSTGKLKILDSPSKVESMSEDSYTNLITTGQNQTEVSVQVKTRSKKLIIAIAIVLGIIIEAGIIFVLECIGNNIKKKEEAEEILKSKTLSIIPRDKAKENKEEAFRSLRTNLQLKDGRVFAVTSASKDNGKTMVSINLAETFAEAGLKTLIIDGNGRNPMVNDAFGLQRVKGISEILYEENSPLIESVDSKLSDTNFENLKVLSWGNQLLNPADLLSKNKLDEILKELKNKFEYIVIDTTSMIKYCDAQIFANKSDAILSVLTERKTNRDDLVRMKELMDISEINIRGIVWIESKL